eukprot:UN04694
MNVASHASIVLHMSNSLSSDVASDVSLYLNNQCRLLHGQSGFELSCIQCFNVSLVINCRSGTTITH